MNWMDAEELAVAVLGLDEETANSDTIEQAVFDKWEISMEQFQEIAGALIPFTIPAKAAISGEAFQGFVKDGAFICRQPVPKVDCKTCVNRAQVDGLSEETHCEHCVWEDRWRTDHYAPNAGDHAPRSGRVD